MTEAVFMGGPPGLDGKIIRVGEDPSHTYALPYMAYGGICEALYELSAAQTAEGRRIYRYSEASAQSPPEHSGGFIHHMEELRELFIQVSLPEAYRYFTITDERTGEITRHIVPWEIPTPPAHVEVNWKQEGF